MKKIVGKIVQKKTVLKVKLVLFNLRITKMLPFTSTDSIPYRLGLGIACVTGAIGGVYLAYQTTKHIRYKKYILKFRNKFIIQSWLVQLLKNKKSSIKRRLLKIFIQFRPKCPAMILL